MDCSDKRYSRNIRIEGFGPEGQRRLCGGSVFIIGCGALGSIAATYLAAAGIGEIGLADYDNVDLSNLQRQIIFNEDDCGKNKAECVERKINSLNSNVKTCVYKKFITKSNAQEILSKYDFIIDATDNPSSKYMIDEVCEKIGKPCCIGGVAELHGQVATYLPGGVRFSDQFPEKPVDCEILPCQVMGVLGPMAGVIASLQAIEAIKYISHFGEPLSNNLLTADCANNRFYTFKNA